MTHSTRRTVPFVGLSPVPPPDANAARSPPLSHFHRPRRLCPNRFLPGCPSDRTPNSKPRATRRYAANFNGVLSVIAADDTIKRCMFVCT